jgi:cytochrome c-type biogenesis protein CcmH/NrfF
MIIISINEIRQVGQKLTKYFVLRYGDVVYYSDGTKFTTTVLDGMVIGELLGWMNDSLIRVVRIDGYQEIVFER